MWVYESDDENAFGGKQHWLRPGENIKFGRVEGDFAFEHEKSISRKHLVIESQTVDSSNYTNASSRTRVTLEDYNTKFGTLVNGEQIRGQTYELKVADNKIKLGKWKWHIRIFWVPVALTFSFTTKEHKSNPHDALYHLLGPLDIRILTDYERGHTTHVVAKKRNTSKGLQALIDGRYIVHNPTFLEALTTAASRTTDEKDAKAPLEEDFEANFPDALQFLPPKGGEPTQRPSSAYAPNTAREDMFQGYTFIFYAKQQYDTLVDPIEGGSGKALFRHVIPEETTVDDFVRYVKCVAGEKGLGEFEDGSEGRGVVVVRYNPVKGAGTEWFAEFGREVSLRLDHRLVEQNEFLDAVLGNDASLLRRRLEVEQSSTMAPLPTGAISQSSPRDVAPARSTAEVAPAEQSRSRRRGRSQFKGFDDDFVAPKKHSSPPSEAMAIDQSMAAEESQSQGLFVSQGPYEASIHMEIDREASEEPQTQSNYSRRPQQSQEPHSASRRRQASQEPATSLMAPTTASKKRKITPIMEEDAFTEIMAPGAAALKRRRLADQADRRARGVSTPLPPPPVKEKSPSPQPPPKRGKGKKMYIMDNDNEMGDIVDKARSRREEKEDAERADRECSLMPIGDDLVAKMRESYIVEMAVQRAAPPVRASRPDESDRWDNKWNGRANFKKFKHRGAAPGPRVERVIVKLVEERKRDFGIGDDYWDDSDLKQRGKKLKGKSLFAKKGAGGETQETSQFSSNATRAPKSRGTSEQHSAELLDEDVGDEVPYFMTNKSQLAASSPDVEIADPLSARTSVSRVLETQSQARASRQSQKNVDLEPTSRGSSNASGSNKRAAPTQLNKPAPAKRPRQAATPVRKVVVPESDDSSDDDLKFKPTFKRRT